MQQPLISFIIPAYNAGLYIAACLESVLALCRRLGECEVIVVDDGSVDNTPEVLLAYKDAHPRMRIITQENRGLSMARNAGMDIARGKYLCFVDADDELNTNCNLTPLSEVVEKGETDIVGIDVQVRSGGRLKPYRRYKYIYNKVYSPAMTFMKGRNLMPIACAYLYRRDFLEREKLRFAPGKYHEDEDFTARAFVKADRFMAVKVPFYTVMPREESITSTTDKAKQRKKLRDVVRILAGLERYAAEDRQRGECMRCKLDYLTVDILRLLIRQQHEREFEKEMIQELKALRRFPLKWRWELKYIAFSAYTYMKYRNL